MATSTAEFRNLVSNYKTITAASRASGNTDPAIRGQLEGLQASLAPYVAEGYTAGGYDDAATISSDISSLIRLIDQNIAAGKSPDKDPVAKKTEENKPDSKSTGENKTNDDSGNKTNNVEGNERTKTSNASNSTTPKSSGPGKRTRNPLGDFSSYTYRISLYALSPDSFNVYKKTGQWDKTSLSLVVQSGGSSTDAKVDAPRGAGFELDYYIDDLEIITKINAKETATATNSFEYKFKVYEPYGLTFPTKLINLKKELNKQSSIKTPDNDFITSNYGVMLLSIKFYGYDETGKIVTSSSYNNGSFSKQLDESATFERSFTVFIKEMNFRLEGKGAVYNIACAAFDQQIGLGSKRNELTDPPAAKGATVEDAIGGTGNSTNGLLDILNQQQQGLKGKSCEIPDEYAVVYEENSAIKKSLLLTDSINKNRTPMATVKKGVGSTVKQQLSPVASTMSPQRVVTFGKGTSILQAIDQIITQSSYVDDALISLQKEDAQPAQEGGPTSDPNANPKALQWYMVTPSVEIIGYDKIRKDYAYKITYVIQGYDVPYVQSANIKHVPKYPGPNKIYNYYYTGKNTEVINYEQTFNATYYMYGQMVFSDTTPNNLTAPVQPKPANNADPIGKPSGTGEGANSIKTFLYSPADQYQAKIKILGDPDFLMPVSSGTIGELMTKWYGPDFSINPNSGQVFIEVIFNQVEDYSNTDGLMTPNGNINTMNFQPNSALSIAKGTVFMVVDVVSRFNDGKFIQEFKTTIPPVEFGIDPYAANGSGKSANGTGRDSSSKTAQEKLKDRNTQAKLEAIYQGQTRAGMNANSSKSNPASTAAAFEKQKQNVRTGSTVNDDQYIPKVGTFGSLGRETPEAINLNKAPTGNSIMFNKR